MSDQVPNRGVFIPSEGQEVFYPGLQTNEGKAEEEDPKTSESDKRKQATRTMCQKMQRQKFKEKMNALRKLVPNCHKRDDVSTVDDAMEYIRNLQCQIHLLQVAQMKYEGGTGIFPLCKFCNFPMMNIPFGLPIQMAPSYDHEASIFGSNVDLTFPK